MVFDSPRISDDWRRVAFNICKTGVQQNGEARYRNRAASIEIWLCMMAISVFIWLTGVRRYDSYRIGAMEEAAALTTR